MLGNKLVQWPPEIQLNVQGRFLRMFLQWDVAQALWDVLFFISERFSTASCDDQTIVLEHPTGNVSDTFFPNSGVWMLTYQLIG